jgi:hypothetical protein
VKTSSLCLISHHVTNKYGGSTGLTPRFPNVGHIRISVRTHRYRPVNITDPSPTAAGTNVHCRLGYTRFGFPSWPMIWQQRTFFSPKWGLPRRFQVEGYNGRGVKLTTHLYLEPSGVPRNFVRGSSTNSIEGRGQREWGSGGGSPLVRGSGGSCNLVQKISFHIVNFS